MKALIRLARDQVRVGWTPRSFERSGHVFSAGTIVVPVTEQPGARAQIVDVAKTLPVTVRALNGEIPATTFVRLPRIGLYKSYAPSLDEGWTRWILEQWALPYSTLQNRDIKRGSLRSRFDAIVLPDQSPGEIMNGFVKGQVPPEYVGGVGEDGVAALRRFVEDGGTLAQQSPLLSGWLIGGKHLSGAAAVAEVPLGAGRVLLFGFRPQYRAQTWATFGLFFNSLFYSTIDPQ